MSGEIIRQARKQNGMTLSELAQAVGVTPAHISQIERNKLEPSLGLLQRLSQALGIPFSSIFPDSNGSGVAVVRAGQGAMLKYRDLNVTCRMLTGATKRDAAGYSSITAMHAALPPGIWVSDTPLNNLTDECIFVLLGRLHIHINTEVHALGQGGSIFIPRSSTYRIENRDECEARFIWSYSTR